jgi:predicted nucleotidyltransferase
MLLGQKLSLSPKTFSGWELFKGSKFIALFFVVSKIMPIFALLMITNMTKDECITLLKKYMSILKDKYGITSLSLFGSTARGEQKEGSDIDLFVDTETPNPFLLMDAKEFLEEATGSSVDIVRNHQNLNPRLRKRILKDGIFVF